MNNKKYKHMSICPQDKYAELDINSESDKMSYRHKALIKGIIKNMVCMVIHVLVAVVVVMGGFNMVIVNI